MLFLLLPPESCDFSKKPPGGMVKRFSLEKPPASTVSYLYSDGLCCMFEKWLKNIIISVL